MAGKSPTVLRILKIVAALLAALNLVAVLVFQYDFSFLALPSGSSENTESVKNTTAYSFSVEADPMTYNGTSKLDLLEGIAVLNEHGEEEDVEIFAEIIGTKVNSEKVIRYSAETPDGQITAERSLILENYAGVSLSLPEELPALKADELDTMVDALSGLEAFHAEDGYGNDLTAEVTAKYKADSNDPTLIQYTFSVTNLFGDTAAAAMDLKTTPVPIITLSTNETVVKVGETFHPLTFVQTAVDSDGVTSLDNYISLEGDKVNTREPGIYHVEFVTYSRINGAKASSVLTVTVEE